MSARPIERNGSGLSVVETERRFQDLIQTMSLPPELNGQFEESLKGRAHVMHVIIDLSEQNASALEAQARAANMLPESYPNKIVERALHGTHPADRPLKPRKSSYGLPAQYGPGPTEEEIDENRREMFRGFGELVP